jgi:type I restriction enzyme, S subunit
MKNPARKTKIPNVCSHYGIATMNLVEFINSPDWRNTENMDNTMKESQAESEKKRIPKGYKQTEAGVIPEDWIIRPMLSIVHVANGQVDPKVEPYRSMVLVAPDHIESATGRLIKKETAAEQGAISGKYLFQRGDIVYSKIRPYLRKAILADFDGLCSADMYPLKPETDIAAGFIFASILGHHFSQFAESVSVRSGMPKINREELSEYSIALPPTLAEQEAIASALSDADGLIESLEKLIAKKRFVKQGAMQELLSGKRRLPGFSGKWKATTMDDLFIFFGGTTASRDQLGTEGYCYLHYGDIHTSKKTFIDLPSESYDIPKLNISLSRIASGSLLKDGDVVFVDASEDDEGASRHIVINNPLNILPFISGLHTIVARSKTASVDNVYKRFCFQTSSIKKQFYFFAVGTKVTGISKSNIGRITIPLPSLAEQSAIASVLSDMDAEIEVLEGRLAKARRIKDGMMQELLTGKIRLVE